jgi:hypothetical protein
MPCYHPLTAGLTAYSFNSKTGKPYRRVIFKENDPEIAQVVQLPCGQCVGCRLERSRQWAIRCMHESQLYEYNCFITLTYNDNNLPSDKSLHYEHFQKFLKRYRKAVSPTKIRFYMAGEYGEEFGRPHFHACIFGHDFSDKKFFKRTASGSNLYTSKQLEDLWPFGYSTIGDVNFESAAYVARYIMKKQTGKDSSSYYELVDVETGEVYNRQPEFNKMSLKPGIGAKWLEKYTNDVYPNDFVILRGKKVKPPKYYDKVYASKNPFEFDEIAFKRENDAKLRIEDNTPERLVVKEIVTKAKLQLLKRTLT